MSTPKSIADILDWQHAHAGEVHYSETAGTRLAFDSAHLTSATDCSGMAIRMLKHFGGAAMQRMLRGATYTGNLCKAGRHITGNHGDAAAGRGMLPGDLVFFTWDGHNSAYDHVAIYGGGGMIWNHGGPGAGPLHWSLAANVHAASEVQVRRYLEPTAPRPTPSHPSPPRGKHLRHTWPSWMPRGHVFGNINSSNMFHGGVNATERAAVRLIQIRFEELGFAPRNQGWADGTWGNPTDYAAKRWHQEYSHPTAHMFSVSEHDWNILFTY